MGVILWYRPFESSSKDKIETLNQTDKQKSPELPRMQCSTKVIYLAAKAKHTQKNIGLFWEIEKPVQNCLATSENRISGVSPKNE